MKYPARVTEPNLKLSESRGCVPRHPTTALPELCPSGGSHSIDMLAGPLLPFQVSAMPRPMPAPGSWTVAGLLSTPNLYSGCPISRERGPSANPKSLPWPHFSSHLLPPAPGCPFHRPSISPGHHSPFSLTSLPPIFAVPVLKKSRPLLTPDSLSAVPGLCSSNSCRPTLIPPLPHSLLLADADTPWARK